MLVLVFLITSLSPIWLAAAPRNDSGNRQGTTQPTYPIRAAFYYPWFPEAWKQQGIYPYTRYTPSLNYYDSTDQATIRKHIDAMQYGNIEAGIVSWWGIGTRSDSRVPTILSASSGNSFRWAFYHEQESQGDPSVASLQADLTYLRDSYGNNPNVLRVDGRFVVFVYSNGNDACGMADRWKRANTVGAYVVLKVFVGYKNCASQPDSWHQYSPAKAVDSQGTYSYAVSPGFYQAGRSLRLGRDLTRWTQNVRDMSTSSAQWQLVTTFNEWGEGTSVESANEWASASGYGAYLDALHYYGVQGKPAAPTKSITATKPPNSTPAPSATTVPTTKSTAVPSATTVPTTNSTPVPSAVAPREPADLKEDFESGTLTQWYRTTNFIVQPNQVANGVYAGRAKALSSVSYAKHMLTTPRTELYYRLRFKIIAQGTTSVFLMKFRTEQDAPLVGMYVAGSNRLGLRNERTGVSTNSSTTIAKDVWYHLQVRVRIQGNTSQTEVWLDGKRVDALSMTTALGTNPIGRLQIGENTSGRTLDIAFDDVAAGPSYIASGTTQPTTPTPAPASATPTPKPPTPTATSTTAVVGTPGATPTQGSTNSVLVGAGDIATCNRTDDEAVANLIDKIPGTVFTLGDNVYESGTAAEFANCYDPSWGRFKARTRPAPGNHEYLTAGGAAYFSYFGANAGTPGKGYYSYNRGAWHIIVINSTCSEVGGCGENSPQLQWLRADLAANPTNCTMAYWHHPRYSSGKHGSFTAMQPIFQALYDANAELVLSGHDHSYERFAPQNATGGLDLQRGIRQFVVGTGGKNHYPIQTQIANSEVRNDDTFGVIKLTLKPNGYDWQFVPQAGMTFTDSGSGTCH